MTGDYPLTLPPVNHTAPVPRRIRATLAGQTVLDTMSALYVWEWSHYPQYYIPLADIDPAVLVDEQHEQKLSRGTARRYSLQVGDVTRPAALRVYGDDAVVEGLAGRARFEWDSLDAWFEEDEQVFVHARDPNTRVDALRSTRSVRVELEGVVLAESSSPVMVFETGLPTRYYLNRTEVDFTHLAPTNTLTACPYKGTTSGLTRGAESGVHPCVPAGAWVVSRDAGRDGEGGCVDDQGGAGERDDGRAGGAGPGCPGVHGQCARPGAPVRGRRRAAGELFSNSIRHSGSGVEGRRSRSGPPAAWSGSTSPTAAAGEYRSCGASGDEAEGVQGLGLVRPGTHDLPPQDRNLMAQH